MSLKRGPTTSLSVPPIGKHRYRLTSLALFLILIAICGIGTIIALKDFDAVKDINGLSNTNEIAKYNTILLDSTFQKHQTELLKIAQEEKKEYRDFFLKICQMILLNLLLPILTAILGYKVGSKDEN